MQEPSRAAAGSAIFLPAPSAQDIARAAAELAPGPGMQLAVFVAEREHPELTDVVDALREQDAQFFGGLFPKLIHDDKEADRGALVLRLPAEHPPLLITGLNAGRPVMPELTPIADAPPGSHTAFVLVDGLTAHVSDLLVELHRRLGNSVHYFGGGCGPLTLQQEPCVFTREGVFQDAAVISFVSQRSRLGVRHGWKLLEGPIVATRTEGNVIHELNWQNAFEVYRDAVEPLLDEKLTPENFFTSSMGFPFGIYKEGEEDVVRDPVSVGPSGELQCVGEVPENAVLNILRGDQNSLVEAAVQAAEDCRAGGALKARNALVVDCVSRTMFLADRFSDELEAVREHVAAIDPELKPMGVLSLGEISSNGQGFVEFFNKTIVIAVLHD